MTSWRAEHRAVAHVERLSAEDLPARRRRDPSLRVLDVRERAEWDSGHIPGSVHRAYHDVREVPAGIDPEGAVAVICSSGQRSAVAASLLSRAGAQVVIHVTDGGVGTWARLGGPIER
jgi:hydroxyacylglutathione hydrolase